GVCLTPANLRYCRYHQTRLEGVGPLTVRAELDAFASLVNDWNGRCARQRFFAQDGAAIDAEVAGRRAALLAEGKPLIWWLLTGHAADRERAQSELTDAMAAGPSARADLPALISLGRKPSVYNDSEEDAEPAPAHSTLILLRADAAGRVQARLHQLGYRIREARGTWGPASRAA